MRGCYSPKYKMCKQDHCGEGTSSPNLALQARACHQKQALNQGNLPESRADYPKASECGLTSF